MIGKKNGAENSLASIRLNSSIPIQVKKSIGVFPLSNVPISRLTQMSLTEKRVLIDIEEQATHYGISLKCTDNTVLFMELDGLRGQADKDIFNEADNNIAVALKTADLKQVLIHLETLHNNLRNNVNINYQQTMQGFMQLLSTSLKILQESKQGNDFQLFEYNLFEKVTQFSTLDRIIQWLGNEIYPKIVKHLSERNDPEKFNTVQKALDYIHDHYNEELSQTILAEKLSVQIPYFIKIFKEVVGCNFSDYVITYRMQKAQELLKRTDLKISEISEILQYSNSQNFIRRFRQITGMTPGKYRECYKINL